MAQVELEIGGRRYPVACRDGEEAHLKRLSGIVAAKAEDARRAVGGVNEVRQLLFASLLLADDLHGKETLIDAAEVSARNERELMAVLGAFADRLERLADALEPDAATA